MTAAVRKLSFKSFLQRTLRELSAEGHTAPHQLAKELPENPRLLQPLCFYVALAYTPWRVRVADRIPIRILKILTHADHTAGNTAYNVAISCHGVDMLTY